MFYQQSLNWLDLSVPVLPHVPLQNVAFLKKKKLNLFIKCSTDPRSELSAEHKNLSSVSSLPKRSFAGQASHKNRLPKVQSNTRHQRSVVQRSK